MQALLVASIAGWLQVAPVAVAPSARADGTAVLMSGSAEMEVDNDEAIANFFLELQDADLARAQSTLNQRVAEGVAALKRADPRAQVETAGYGSSPIHSKTTARSIVGWRVRQSVTLRTMDLAALPKAVAAGQQQLALAAIDFRVSRASRERHEAELIRRAIANFNARVAAAAQALNVAPARVRVEEMNFGMRVVGPGPILAQMRGDTMSAQSVVEPSLDPGRTTLQQNVDGKVRLLAQ